MQRLIMFFLMNLNLILMHTLQLSPEGHLVNDYATQMYETKVHLNLAGQMVTSSDTLQQNSERHLTNRDFVLIMLVYHSVLYDTTLTLHSY